VSTKRFTSTKTTVSFGLSVGALDGLSEQVPIFADQAQKIRNIGFVKFGIIEHLMTNGAFFVKTISSWRTGNGLKEVTKKNQSIS